MILKDRQRVGAVTVSSRLGTKCFLFVQEIQFMLFFSVKFAEVKDAEDGIKI